MEKRYFAITPSLALCIAVVYKYSPMHKLTDEEKEFVSKLNGYLEQFANTIGGPEHGNVL